jgi:hypothetical protein
MIRFFARWVASATRTGQSFSCPKGLEELASFDPQLVVGVLGGGEGTTRDTFELLFQSKRTASVSPFSAERSTSQRIRLHSSS